MSRRSKIETSLAAVEGELSRRLRTTLPDVVRGRRTTLFTNRDFNPYRLLENHYGAESDALLDLAREAQAYRRQVDLPTDSGPAHLYLEACRVLADLRDSNRLGPRRLAEDLLRALDSDELATTKRPADLIPTASRERLPGGFSYPASAKEISEALREVPQFDAIRLNFQLRDAFWASEWQLRIRELGPVSLLEANYWADWHLSVHAVPSRYKPPARAALLERGLRELAEALIGAQVNPYRFTYSVDFDLASAEEALRDAT